MKNRVIYQLSLLGLICAFISIGFTGCGSHDQNEPMTSQSFEETKKDQHVNDSLQFEAFAENNQSQSFSKSRASNELQREIEYYQSNEIAGLLKRLFMVLETLKNVDPESSILLGKRKEYLDGALFPVLEKIAKKNKTPEMEAYLTHLAIDTDTRDEKLKIFSGLLNQLVPLVQLYSEMNKVVEDDKTPDVSGQSSILEELGSLPLGVLNTIIDVGQYLSKQAIEVYLNGWESGGSFSFVEQVHFFDRHILPVSQKLVWHVMNLNLLMDPQTTQEYIDALTERLEKEKPIEEDSEELDKVVAYLLGRPVTKRQILSLSGSLEQQELEQRQRNLIAEKEEFEKRRQEVEKGEKLQVTLHDTVRMPHLYKTLRLLIDQVKQKQQALVAKKAKSRYVPFIVLPH